MELAREEGSFGWRDGLGAGNQVFERLLVLLGTTAAEALHKEVHDDRSVEAVTIPADSQNKREGCRKLGIHSEKNSVESIFPEDLRSLDLLNAER